jgi:hypothetical protein
MRKATFLALVGLLLLGASSAWAQGGRWVIQPLAGYRTSGDFGLRPEADIVTDVSGIKFQDGFAYGLSLGYRLSPYVTMEAQWTRSETMAQAIAYYTGQPNIDLFNVAEDVIHANFLFYFGENALVKPFFITGLGVTLADGKANETFQNVGSVSRFSWNLGLGVEKMFNEKFGIRITAKWFTTYINDTMAWWYDWWWGGYYLVPVSQYMGQWDFTGGLIYRF